MKESNNDGHGLKENERQRLLDEAEKNLCEVRTSCESVVPGLLDKAQTNKRSMRTSYDSVLPGFLHEVQVIHILCKVKKEIIPKVVFKNEKTKQAWLMLSGLEGVNVDEDGAVALLQEIVKEGDTDAMWMLGICYEYGRGIEQDIEQAEKLYQQSSDGGNEIGKYFVSHEWCGRGSGKMEMRRL